MEQTDPKTPKRDDTVVPRQRAAAVTPEDNRTGGITTDDRTPIREALSLEGSDTSSDTTITDQSQDKEEPTETNVDAELYIMFGATRTPAELPTIRTEPWPYGNKKPNPISIHKARKLLAAAYATIPCELEEADVHGHAWIIETDKQWKARNNVSEVVTVPTKPRKEKDYDIKKQLAYADKMETYKLYNHLMQQGKTKLIEWFGKAMFSDLYVDGLLPTETTPKELLDHLTKTYAQGPDARRYMEEIETEFNAPYDPKKPVENYFMKLQDVRAGAALLDQPYTERQTMNKALKQFEKHYGKDAYKAEKKWNDEEDQSWEKFKTYWKNEIHQWEMLRKNSRQAHQAVKEDVDELTERMKTMEIHMEELQAENKSVQAENNALLTRQIQFQQALQSESKSRGSSDDISVLTDFMSRIERRLEGYNTGPQGNYGTQGNSQGFNYNERNNSHHEREPDGPNTAKLLDNARRRAPDIYRSQNNGRGRRFNKYCWHCGVNCTHWTRGCYEISDPDKVRYANADFDNPMGGNTKFLERRGKYQKDFGDKACLVSNAPAWTTDKAEDDEATVVTSNTTDSWKSRDTIVDSITSTESMALQACPPTPIPTHNPFAPLAFDDDCIVVDSGASEGFGDEDTPGTDRKATPFGITMASATGDCRTSIATDKFDLPLPPESLQYHVFKRGEIQRPLLSVGKACDAGCKVTFERDKCEFTKDETLLLTGYRDQRTGLYLLPKDLSQLRDLSQPLGLGLPRQRTLQNGLNAYELTTVPRLIRYLHACAGYPSTDTWIQAIDQGHYVGWPGLTAARVRKYLPKSEETALGHLKLTRQGVRSTKGDNKAAEPTPITTNDDDEEAHDDNERITAEDIGRRRNVVANSIPLKDLKGIIGTDQTGRFPVTSDRDHKYIFLLYDVDTEYIHAVPIKSREKGELVRAFQEAYEALTACGFEPVLHRTDHETSRELTNAIEERGLNYELVPPSNHRRNPAERAIQTFKSHFISIINGLDPDYPPGAWDLLIPQANMTLNMLRSCRVNPNHSAYSYIHGVFDFNAHPLAPLGCRAIVHERTVTNGGKRGSWGNKGKVGYYLGPAMRSYRVWRFFIPETNGIQESDTAAFFPRDSLPTVTVGESIAGALRKIEDILTDPKPPHTIVTEDDEVCEVIKRLREMYKATHIIDTTATPPKALTPHNTDAEATRVQSKNKGVAPPRVPRNTMNKYKPKKKQRHPIGTRVRVKEKAGTFIGKATNYDPHTGLYHIVFEDGEWDEFNDDEMDYFVLVKPFKPRKPTSAANQVTVHGFFPKASLSSTILYGMNAGSIWDEETKKWMAYRDLIKHPNPKIRARWNNAGNNEFARLAQGFNGVDGLNVVTFIAQREMPEGKQATYARYVVDYRPEKDEPWRLRITCGGDKLDYYGETVTHSASMETIKCQLNSIVSTEGAKCATGDISNMYLESLLPEAEYVRFRMDLIPKEFTQAYKLNDLATPNGFVYARVNKAWYGLKQAGRIAHDDLVERLAEAGYHKNTLVEGYFKHETRAIDFTLVVDDFLIKYQHEEDLEHLCEAIRKYYTFKVDTDAKQYVGINLKWDYVKRTVRLSMDGYIEQALSEFEYQASSKPHHAPSRYILPNFGERIQYVKIDNTPPLDKTKITFIQRVVGKLLYYARAVDPTMLHAINDISLNVTKGTEATLDATMYLLNYAHTHPDSEIIYRKSDMILHVDSDAAYLVAPEARSRAGGYHYLSDKKGEVFNGPILVLAKVIKNVMASAAEAELGALFMNGQEAAGLRNCLEAMGFPQPATPLRTDNSTANGIINNTMRQKRSKAIDVRFYWLRDRVKQGQFLVFWDSGKNNKGDFYTKHHPPTFHIQHRPIHTFVEGLSPETLQGCIEIMNGTRPKKSRRKTHNLSVGIASLIAQDQWLTDKPIMFNNTTR